FSARPLLHRASPPPPPPNMDTLESIRARRTLKVFRDPETPLPAAPDGLAEELGELMEAATQAPFHYPCHTSHRADGLDSPVPWRFYDLDAMGCRAMIEWIEREGERAGKMPHMLAAADACVLVTWLPDPPAGGGATDDERAFQGYEPTHRNMEHIAGAASAVQNLLLAATSKGRTTYWSSGGVFRTEPAYQHLGIPSAEILLGAIFLFPDVDDGLEARPGKHRDSRGPRESWSRTLRP
ncbi:MAG: nitroreductase family protein, partial [Planctomycetota bacterium]